MTIQAGSEPRTRVPASYDGYYDEEEDRGYGWVVFAGVPLLMLGTLNFIEGIAAIGNSHFLVANAHRFTRRRVATQMFFGSNRRQGRPVERIAARSEDPYREPAQRQAQRLQAWRESAQAVTRAWRAWLAAESHQRDIRYDAYLAALEDEQRAAANVAREFQALAEPDTHR
jgi:hypothetical protein